MIPFSLVKFGNDYYPLQSFFLSLGSSIKQWIHLFYADLIWRYNLCNISWGIFLSPLYESNFSNCLWIRRPMENKMATHSSVLAWRIPGTGGPGGLPSMGSHRVGHDWSDLGVFTTSATWEAHSRNMQAMSIDRGMDKEDVYIYTMEYYSAIKRMK